VTREAQRGLGEGLPFEPRGLERVDPDPLGAGDPTARFGALLDRTERLRVGGLSFDEVRELGRLYRLHAARLARLRDRDDDPERIRHLNALCVRAYGFLYADRPGAPGERRLAATLADALARTWRAQAVAWLLLLAGAGVGALLAARDTGALYALIPSSFGYSEGGIDELSHSAEARARFLEGHETPASQNALFGSTLFVHNTRVGLLSLATGVLAGVPTVLLQLYNGLMLGAFGWLFLRDPDPWPFLAWLLPHGIPELTAVTLCASAGLVLGGAVAAPGRAGRRAALRAAQAPVLLLFGAAVPLLALAAGMESFVRESALSIGARLGIAALLAAGVVAGLAAVRRLARRREADVSWLRGLSRAPRAPSADSG
jgi:uncharacterized membrane protein SpoIIM required for sporulation